MYPGEGKNLVKALRKVEKTGSKVAKTLLKERSRCEGVDIARTIFRESMEMYSNGDMNWKATVSDLTKTLSAFDPEDYATDEADDALEEGEAKEA